MTDPPQRILFSITVTSYRAVCKAMSGKSNLLHGVTVCMV